MGSGSVIPQPLMLRIPRGPLRFPALAAGQPGLWGPPGVPGRGPACSPRLDGTGAPRFATCRTWDRGLQPVASPCPDPKVWGYSAGVHTGPAHPRGMPTPRGWPTQGDVCPGGIADPRECSCRGDTRAKGCPGGVPFLEDALPGGMPDPRGCPPRWIARPKGMSVPGGCPTQGDVSPGGMPFLGNGRPKEMPTPGGYPAQRDVIPGRMPFLGDA